MHEVACVRAHEEVAFDLLRYHNLRIILVKIPSNLSSNLSGVSGQRCVFGDRVVQMRYGSGDVCSIVTLAKEEGESARTRGDGIVVFPPGGGAKGRKPKNKRPQ